MRWHCGARSCSRASCRWCWQQIQKAAGRLWHNFVPEPPVLQAVSMAGLHAAASALHAIAPLWGRACWLCSICWVEGCKPRRVGASRGVHREQLLIEPHE